MQGHSYNEISHRIIVVYYWILNKLVNREDHIWLEWQFFDFYAESERGIFNFFFLNLLSIIGNEAKGFDEINQLFSIRNVDWHFFNFEKISFPLKKIPFHFFSI